MKKSRIISIIAAVAFINGFVFSLIRTVAAFMSLEIAEGILSLSGWIMVPLIITALFINRRRSVLFLCYAITGLLFNIISTVYYYIVYHMRFSWLYFVNFVPSGILIAIAIINICRSGRRGGLAIRIMVFIPFCFSVYSYINSLMSYRYIMVDMPYLVIYNIILSTMSLISSFLLDLWIWVKAYED